MYSEIKHLYCNPEIWPTRKENKKQTSVQLNETGYICIRPLFFLFVFLTANFLDVQSKKVLDQSSPNFQDW